ncbi:MAG: carboxypeptidase-like regulatory domain-containing protein [Planctomycetes bacterium]|nr:carboxypeptidase-like regulatory domain-containing protein [Planctomycetota bacterium]
MKPLAARLPSAAALALLCLAVAAAPESGEGASVAVTATGPDGRPVARGEARLFEAGAGATRREPPAEEGPMVRASAPLVEGRGALLLPGAGRWRVVVMAPGLAPAEAEVAWVEGLPAPRVDLCLPAEGVLEGRVLRNDVEPVPGVEIVARAGDGRTEVRARSGPDGAWRLAGLAPGAHALWTRRNDGPWLAECDFRSPAVARLDLRLVDGALIEGRVTSRETGEALHGARVELVGDEFSEGFGGAGVLARAISDTSGAYALRTGRPWVNGGGLRVTAPGFATHATKDRGLWNLGDGETYRRDIALGPGLDLAGQVTGPGGPVGGARVVLWSAGAGRSGRLGRTVASTAPDGTFRIEGLAPGKYAVEVEAEGLVHPGWNGPEWPGERRAREVPGEAWIDLGAGQGLTVDVRLAGHGAGPVVVTGRVLDEDGGPVALASVAATGGGREVLTGPDGSFRVEAHPRPGWAFAVSVSKRGYTDEEVHADPADPAACTGLVVVLSRSPVVRGRVRVTAGPPAGGGRVFVARLSYGKYGDAGAGWAGEPQAVLAADGSFEVPVPSIASVEGEGGSSFAGCGVAVYALGVVATGHAPVVPEPVELERGRSVYEVEIALAEGLRLAGAVRDAVTGAPLAGASVGVHQGESYGWPPLYPPGDGAVCAFTGGEGRFLLADLAPGRATVRVEAVGYEEKWVDVAVPAAGPVEVRLYRQRPLAGVVVDAEDRPVRGARVRLVDEEGAERFGELATDDEGRFRFARIGGRYAVVAEDPGSTAGLAPDVVGPADPGREDLRLVLRPGLALDGRLLDAAGRPLAGVVASAGPDAGRPPRSYARTDAEGRFRLSRLPPGPWAVRFHEPGVTVRGVRPGAVFEYRLVGGLTLSGRVRRQEWDALSGPDGELEAVRLGPSASRDVEEKHVADLADDGTFVFRYLPPGTYRISGSVAAGFHDRPRHFVLREEVHVRAGSPDVELRLRFAEGE